MLDRLGQIRRSMNGAKNTKLMMRWEKHGDYRQYSLTDLIDALSDEFDELTEALSVLGPSDIRDEVLDVVNQLEFLWDVLELNKT